MKKIIVTGLAAAALLALSYQPASAWFKFGLGASFNTGLAWGGHNFNFRSQGAEGPCCAPPCYPPGYPPGYGYRPAGPAGYAQGAPAPGYLPPAPPASANPNYPTTAMPRNYNPSAMGGYSPSHVRAPGSLSPQIMNTPVTQTGLWYMGRPTSGPEIDLSDIPSVPDID